jgi:hypothetical protein
VRPIRKPLRVRCGPPSESDVWSGRSLLVPTSCAARTWLRRAALSGFSNLREHRWRQKEIGQIGIELNPSAGADLFYRLVDAFRVVIRPTRSYRVKGVSDRDYARSYRDCFSAQSARISCSIPSLVMRNDPVTQFWIKSVERLEYLAAAFRMRHHGLPLLGRELVGVVENVEERFVNLSDVMEQRDTLDFAALRFLESGSVRQHQRVLRNASHVRSRDRVVRVDRIEQRLEGRCCQAFGTAAQPSLANGERAYSRRNRSAQERNHDRRTCKNFTACGASS